jgi:hypothetical protein
MLRFYGLGSAVATDGREADDILSDILENYQETRYGPRES